MANKKLLLGGSGFLGRNIMKNCHDLSIIGTYFRNKNNEDLIHLNLDFHENVEKILESLKPSLIIDASNPDFSIRYFSRTIKNMEKLLSICKQMNTKFVYVSSDAVFDGNKGNYKETDTTNPISDYGKLKQAIEKLICIYVDEHLIVRTSLLFGLGVKKWNFVLWVINNLKNNHPIQVISDQLVSPSYCPNVAEMILEAVNNDLTGIIHLAGSSQITRYDFAKLICEFFSLKKSSCIPVRMEEININEPKGKNFTLNVSKAQSILKSKPMTLTEALQRMKSDEATKQSWDGEWE